MEKINSTKQISTLINVVYFVHFGSTSARESLMMNHYDIITTAYKSLSHRGTIVKKDNY